LHSISDYFLEIFFPRVELKQQLNMWGFLMAVTIKNTSSVIWRRVVW